MKDIGRGEADTVQFSECIRSNRRKRLIRLMPTIGSRTRSAASDFQPDHRRNSGISLEGGPGVFGCNDGQGPGHREAGFRSGPGSGRRGVRVFRAINAHVAPLCPGVDI